MNLEINLNTRIDKDRNARMKERMKMLQIKDKSEYVRRLIDQDCGPVTTHKKKAR